ncbi:MAG: hypothetical protein V9H69_07440 [Anaerolineae bacterium]
MAILRLGTTPTPPSCGATPAAAAGADTNMTTVSGFDTATHTNLTPPTNATANLYYGRATNTFEVAIPWAALGYTAWTAGSGSNPPTCSSGLCRPTLASAIHRGGLHRLQRRRLRRLRPGARHRPGVQWTGLP